MMDFNFNLHFYLFFFVPRDFCYKKKDSSRSPSPQKQTHLTVTTIPAMKTKPNSQFVPGRPRDDSTESDQSFPHSQSQTDGIHKLT